MSITQNKYAKALGEIWQFDIGMWMCAGMLFMPLKLHKRSGWWEYECLIIKESPHIKHQHWLPLLEAGATWRIYAQSMHEYHKKVS